MGAGVFYRSEVRNLGVQGERADVRWVGVTRKKSTQVFLGGGVLRVGSASD